MFDGSMDWSSLSCMEKRTERKLGYMLTFLHNDVKSVSSQPLTSHPPSSYEVQIHVCY
jgi:hypothetical protein